MNELGNISIASDVVATIASSVASEVDGVYSLAGASGKGDLGKFLKSVGSSGSTSGVEVEVGETECTVDLYLVAKIGYQLPALAGEVQTKVVKAINDMTGLKVQEVNVYIQKVIKADGNDQKKIKAEDK